MKKQNNTQYNRRYHLQRALKPVLHINSNSRAIDMPEGLELCPTDKKRVDALVNEYGYVLQAVIPVEAYKKIMLYNSLGICGNNIGFKLHKFFGLTPGTQITKLGSGKPTEGNSIDHFATPATYTGSIIINLVKYYAFLVQPKQAKLGLKYYLLYEIVNNQPIRLLYKKDKSYDKTLIFKLEFKLVKPVPEVKKDNQNILKF